MREIKLLSSYEQIKILSAPHRLDILQYLMAVPATLTQLGQVLGKTPAWVRHHIKTLEAAGLVEIADIQTHGIVVEKYYRSCANAYLLQQLVLPSTSLPVLISSGSHDLAFEWLAERLSRFITLLSLPVGSLDGLMNLRQGLCQIAGSHLLDESGEYNTAYVRRFFPDRQIKMVTLANRTQGLMFARDNPKMIRTLSDLMRPDICFVNRNAGSGTRLWLDMQLKKSGIPLSSIHEFDRAVKTHTEAALLVKNGQADVAIGLQAAAHQFELGFIPLFDERYDFVFLQENEKSCLPLLDEIQTSQFRQILTQLTGYNSSQSGNQLLV